MNNELARTLVEKMLPACWPGRLSQPLRLDVRTGLWWLDLGNIVREVGRGGEDSTRLTGHEAVDDSIKHHDQLAGGRAHGKPPAQLPVPDPARV